MNLVVLNLYLVLGPLLFLALFLHTLPLLMLIVGSTVVLHPRELAHVFLRFADLSEKVQILRRHHLQLGCSYLALLDGICLRLLRQRLILHCRSENSGQEFVCRDEFPSLWRWVDDCKEFVERLVDCGEVLAS